MLAQSASVAAAAPPFWWVSPLVIFFGAIVAVVAILTNRRVARTKATLDLIERTESSESYAANRRAFRSLKDDPSDANLDRLIRPKTDADKLTAKQIFTYLNHYELIAVGCFTGILDEGFYARWMRTTIVEDWAISKEFIRQARLRPSSSAALFIEFQTLARRFETERERRKRMALYKGWLRRFYAGRAR